jgi:hypothetical protein
MPVTNERSILTSSSGSCFEVRQRRVAGAEVVEREAHAEGAQALEHLGDAARIAPIHA